jgi:hypothetical protein
MQNKNSLNIEKNPLSEKNIYILKKKISNNFKIIPLKAKYNNINTVKHFPSSNKE